MLIGPRASIGPATDNFHRDVNFYSMENHGPLGTLWAGVGIGCFFLALTWVNTLLGGLLTPLFIMPITKVLDKLKKKGT
jgi:hypothetical protein